VSQEECKETASSSLEGATSECDGPVLKPCFEQMVMLFR